MLALPRFSAFAAAAITAGGLLLCSGCGQSAADAHSPPPQSLSEPVVASEAAYKAAPPAPAPAIPADPVVRTQYESRALPAFVEPAPPPAPAPVAAPAPAASAPGSGTVHVLAKGETLYALSRKYNVNVNKIIAANQFKDPNHLAIGTKVIIPN